MGTLLKGGYVLTMDPVLGDLPEADVLVEEGRIARVATAISAPGHRVIDASGAIVIPGFVDTHRHTWQTQLRAMCADWALGQYGMAVRLTASQFYTPEDVLIGNWTGALEALNGGITSILDFSHVMKTPAHADAAVAGLKRAGVRALFCFGFCPILGEGGFASHRERFEDVRRLARDLQGDSLVRVGAAMTELPLVKWDDRTAEIRVARELGTHHVLHTSGRNLEISAFTRRFAAEGLLGDDQVHVHCNHLDDDEWQLLAKAGAAVSISPETELNMGMGSPAVRECLAHGIEPTLSCDIVGLGAGEMFTQMRLALGYARYQSNSLETGDLRLPDKIEYTARDALRWATINGAAALGLGAAIGSITPGKRADLAVIDCWRAVEPSIVDAAAAVVFQSTPADVKTVLVDGRIVKENGNLVGVKYAEAIAAVQNSAEALVERIRRAYPAFPAAGVNPLEVFRFDWVAQHPAG